MRIFNNVLNSILLISIVSALPNPEMGIQKRQTGQATFFKPGYHPFNFGISNSFKIGWEPVETLILNLI